MVTPNIPEAETIVGRALVTDADFRDAAREIVALGARNVVIKGGHRAATRMICSSMGADFHVLRARRIDTPTPTAPVATFSAAIAAGLAEGSAWSKR